MSFGNASVIAGVFSTILFTSSNIPMLLKAIKTRDLGSYSLGYLILSNIGNLIHWIYILSLPFGPIWLLHGFFTLTCGLMLIWYIRFEGLPINQSLDRLRPAPAGEIISWLKRRFREIARCGCSSCDCKVFCLCTLATA